MATDFFEQQDLARRKTGRLVFYFALAVLAILALLYGFGVIAVGYQGQDPITGASRWNLVWWSPELLAQVTLFTGLIVGGGSLYKIAQLRGGGRIVAESLGGRQIHPDTADVSERRLMNVVEEMAIASGTAAPPVYLLEGEAGINAFAAGFTPDDAVIGVTRGCVERLTRDQLQGVIAHEFSHILNGDMRLNIRLMGVVHGILLIGIIGYFLMRSAAFSGATRRRDDRGNGAAAMLGIGLALIAIGFVGTFFGNLIKASVSRQREFLADASAVQFTRNPEGLSGALKVIGGLDEGSRIEHPNAPEASHMFFSLGVSSMLGSLFSTHPPLLERIRRLEPSFDGEAVGDASAASRAADASRTTLAAGAAGFSGGSPRGAAADLPTGIDQIGAPTAAHLSYAAALIARIPAPVIEAAHGPYGARAVVYCLLIDSDPSVRSAQLRHLAEHADAAVVGETRRLLPLFESVAPEARLPLIDLSIPSLRELTRAQYDGFVGNVGILASADRKIDLFEWTLQRILVHHLAPGFERVRSQRVRYSSLARVADACTVVLSLLAHAGGRSERAALYAFECGARELEEIDLEFLSADRCDLARFDASLEKLSALAPKLQQSFLHACAVCVSADREVTVMEAELLRATSDALGCPMPPLLPGQSLV